MPPEALLGMTDANHWTAWQVQDAIWRSHLAPISQQFCDDLTRTYLRPAALAEGIDRAEEIVVAYDATAILTNPDRGKDAAVLYDKRAIGKTALRDSMGFSDEDAPTQEELDEMLAVALRDVSLLGIEEPEPEVIVAPPLPLPPPEEEEGPPVTEPDPERETPADQATARVLGAAEMALARCRELAGSRVRSKFRGKPEMAVCDGEPNAAVCSTLGAVTLESLSLDPTSLVSGGGDTFVNLVGRWGYPQPQAEALGQMLEMYAARTLFEERPPAAPVGFAGYLRRSQ